MILKNMTLEQLQKEARYKAGKKGKEIIINKEWFDKLVCILDKLNEQIEIDDKCVETHGWLSHLNGYIHSLDEYFKN